MRPRGPFAPSVRGFDVLEARSTQGLSLGLAHPGKGASGVSDIHTSGHEHPLSPIYRSGAWARLSYDGTTFTPRDRQPYLWYGL